MHFAKARNLAAMALAWALFLLAYDQHANPRPVATYWADFMGSSTRPTVLSEGGSPRLRLSLPHLCCATCLDDIRAAVAALTWLGPARVDPEPAALETSAANAGDASAAHELEFDIVDLAQANFVALDAALRDAGSVPDRIEIFGMGHFRLEVELPRCCTACSRAVDDQLERFLVKETQGRWLDSISLSSVEKSVIIYARLNAVVDLVELTRALERAGLEARAIRVLTGPES